jgi:hypothetical protein
MSRSTKVQFWAVCAILAALAFWYVALTQGGLMAWAAALFFTADAGHEILLYTQKRKADVP